jgi:hypothetical protein
MMGRHRFRWCRRAASDPTNLGAIPFSVAVPEVVTNFISGDVTVVNGSVTNFAGNGGTNFTFGVVPVADGTVTVSVAAGVCTDLAGNTNQASNAISLVYDSTVPTPVVSTSASDPTNLGTIPFSVDVVEAVTNFAAVDVTVVNGSVTNFAGSSGTNFTFGVVPVADGTVTVSVAAGVCTDLAGNTNEASNAISLVYDGTAPIPVVSTSASDPTNLGVIPFSVAIAEVVTNFISGDVTVVNGSVTNFAGSGGTNFTFGVVPVADGTVTVSVAAGICTDLAGNTNEASNAISLVYDGTAPIPVVSTSASDPTNLGTIPFSVDVIESVTNFAAVDVTVVNGSVTNFAGSGGTNFTFGVVPVADGTVTVSVAAGVCTDLAGNTNLASNSISLVYDGTAPVPVISTTASAPTKANVIPINVAVAEAVTNFISGDVTVSNGSVTNFAGGGTNFTFGVVPAADGTVTVSVASGVLTDLAGNTNEASNIINIFSDRTAPVVQNLAASPSPARRGEVVEITFRLNDQSAITNAEVTVNLRDASYQSISNGVYTYHYTIVTNDNDGAAQVTIRAQDAAGNSGMLIDMVVLDVDQSPPLRVYGTNGAPIANGETVSMAKGTDFGHFLVGTTNTHSFTMTNNNWRQNVVISGWHIEGTDASQFSASGITNVLATNGVASVFAVSYTPSTAGEHSATLVISNNTPDVEYRMPIRGGGCALSPAAGPLAGGNTVVVTNGNFGTITNVTVHGQSATIVTNGISWFAIDMPPGTNIGPASLLIERGPSSSDILLLDAYEYNPSGSISQVTPASAEWLGGDQVTIVGTNLTDAGNLSDLTSVTLAGVSISNIVSATSTQLVVTTGIAPGPISGDVRIESMAYGEILLTNAFAYTKADQTITFPTIPDQTTTNVVGLAASADSGLNVSFQVVSGPALITGSTNLSFSGTGVVTVVAQQAGNTNWNAAADATNVFDVTKAVATVSLGALSQTYNGTPRNVTVQTVPSGLTVVVNYDGVTNIPVNAGSYAIVAAVDDTTYQGQASGTLVVAKASQTITMANPGLQVVTNVTPINATASSGVTPVTLSIDSGNAVLSQLTAPAQLTYSSPGLVTVRATQAGNANWLAAVATITFRVRADRVPYADFDGDGKSDLSVYHQPSGDWYIVQSAIGDAYRMNWGWSETIPVPGDYDGNGVTDLAVYNQNVGDWYVLTNGTTLYPTINWGWSATQPVPADYDGDGVTDFAVYHQSSGDWYITRSSAGDARKLTWGWWETIPVPGDYDGDGIDDLAVYNQNSGDWYVLESGTGASRTKNWGSSAMIPVPGDYDGDGLTDLAVYHQASGDWYVIQSSSGVVSIKNWGWRATIPVPGDYDGDGIDDLAVYYQSAGLWYILESATGNTREGVRWGWGAPYPPWPAWR